MNPIETKKALVDSPNIIVKIPRIKRKTKKKTKDDLRKNMLVRRR
jgi:hypothetical protein